MTFQFELLNFYTQELVDHAITLFAVLASLFLFIQTFPPHENRLDTRRKEIVFIFILGFLISATLYVSCRLVHYGCLASSTINTSLDRNRVFNYYESNYNITDNNQCISYQTKREVEIECCINMTYWTQIEKEEMFEDCFRQVTNRSLFREYSVHVDEINNNDYQHLYYFIQPFVHIDNPLPKKIWIFLFDLPYISDLPLPKEIFLSDLPGHWFYSLSFGFILTLIFYALIYVKNLNNVKEFFKNIWKFLRRSPFPLVKVTKG